MLTITTFILSVDVSVNESLNPGSYIPCLSCQRESKRSNNHSSSLTSDVFVSFCLSLVSSSLFTLLDRSVVGEPLSLSFLAVGASSRRLDLDRRPSGDSDSPLLSP